VVSEIARSVASIKGIQVAADGVTNFEVKIRILKSSYEDLLNESDAPFFTGMSASVEIQTHTETNVPCLPIEAVSTRIKEKNDSLKKSGEDELDEVVFSVANGKAIKHVVSTGIQDSRYIQITMGLDSVEKVIVGPYDAVSRKLSDGKAVSVSTKKMDIKLEE
jgi:HlyD family secretion protein